jgi:hypothetical protein
MKLLLLALMTATSFAGHTRPLEKNCFAQHIQESIEVNSQRKPFYSKLTQGHSDKIFTELILGENLALPVAKFYDFRARSFQKKGMPLFCHEFLPMNRRPTFRTDQLKPLKEKFVPFKYVSVRHELMKAISKKDNETIKRIAFEAIEDLKSAPGYHCLARHFLESIYRFSYFLPTQIESAQKNNLSSPLGITMEVMRLHALSLNTCSHIDRLSAPIQAMGIPVLCSELPHLVDDL